VRREESGSKKRSKWKSELCEAGEHRRLDFGQRVGLKALPSHRDLPPGDLLSLG